MNSSAAAHSNIPNDNLLPDSCFVFIASNGPGKYIGMVKRGERGYYQTDYDFEDKEMAIATVDFMNDKLNVTKLQAECMYNGSLFGWETPGANPEWLSKNMPELTV